MRPPTWIPGPLERSERANAILVAVVLAGGGILLGAHARRYGIPDLASLDWSLLGAPSLPRLIAMMRTLLWLALLNASAWSCGTLLESVLPLPPPLVALRQVIRIAAGLAVLAIAVLGLAAVHGLVRPAFAALLLAPPVAAAARVWHRRQAAGARRSLPRPSRLLVILLWGYVLLLVNAYLGALSPTPGWDALTYHLAFPARYLDENAVFMTPFSHLSGYVAITEMLYVLALAISGPGLAVLVHFEFGLLVMASVWYAVRPISLRAAALAPLVLLADPLFQTELGWAYSDLSLALFTILATLALHAWMRDETRRGALIWAGLLIGAACATRYLAVNYALALVAAVWLPPRRRTLRANAEATLVLTGGALLVTTPFLVRNALFTGNPVTPLLQTVFYASGAEYIPEIVMRQSASFLRFVGMGRDPAALLALPWNLVVRSVPGTYTDSFGFQVGSLYAFAPLAALLISDARRDPLVSFVLKVAAIGVLLWFYTFQEPRFLIPVFPLLAIAGAVGLDRAAQLARPFGRLVLLLPIMAAIYCQLVLLGEFSMRYAAVVGAGKWVPSQDRDAIAAADFLRGEMRGGERVLLWLEQRAFFFRGLDYVPYHIGSGAPALHFVHGFRDAEALHCGLSSIGVTHVLVNNAYRHAAPGLYVEGYGRREFVRDLERVERLVRGDGELRFKQGAIRVYRLPDARCDDHGGTVDARERHKRRAAWASLGGA